MSKKRYRVVGTQKFRGHATGEELTADFDADKEQWLLRAGVLEVVPAPVRSFAGSRRSTHRRRGDPPPDAPAGVPQSPGPPGGTPGEAAELVGEPSRPETRPEPA